MARFWVQIMRRFILVGYKDFQKSSTFEIWDTLIVGFLSHCYTKSKAILMSREWTGYAWSVPSSSPSFEDKKRVLDRVFKSVDELEMGK